MRKKKNTYQTFSLLKYFGVRATLSQDQVPTWHLLRPKAEDKGDHYLVNGSKTWTTMAQFADMIFCLVRTSNEEIRQMGHFVFIN